MENSRCAILISEPGPLCDGLQALLGAIPNVQPVSLAYDGSDTLATIEQYHPNLMLMNPEASGERVCDIVREIKQYSPQTSCVVLTQKTQYVRGIKAAGADKVLLRGVQASKLVNMLEGMLA